MSIRVQSLCTKYFARVFSRDPHGASKYVIIILLISWLHVWHMYICCTYSYSCTYSYIRTYPYTRVYAWVQKSDEGVGCLPPSLPSYTLRLGLLRNLGLIDWASCLADQRGPRTRLSLLPNASVMDMCCNAQLLHGSWGSELRILYLLGRHCTNWAISPLRTVIIPIGLLWKTVLRWSLYLSS